jgi:hypothetical protein
MAADFAIGPGRYSVGVKSRHCSASSVSAITVMSQKNRSVALVLTPVPVMESSPPYYLVVNVPQHVADAMNIRLERIFRGNNRLTSPRVEDGTAYFDSLPAGTYRLSIQWKTLRACKAITIDEARPTDSVRESLGNGEVITLTSQQLTAAFQANQPGDAPDRCLL